jgi:hypothetical protein
MSRKHRRHETTAAEPQPKLTDEIAAIAKGCGKTAALYFDRKTEEGLAQQRSRLRAEMSTALARWIPQGKAIPPHIWVVGHQALNDANARAERDEQRGSSSSRQSVPEFLGLGSGNWSQAFGLGGKRQDWSTSCS